MTTKLTRIKIIQRLGEVDELIAHCKKTGYASVDFETTHFNFQDENQYPLILGVSFQAGSSWIIPLQHFESPFRRGRRWRKALRKFGKEVIENPDIIKICWNLKFEYKWFLRYGIRMKGRLFDGMLAKYCLNEERPHDLKSFAAEMFPTYANYEDIVHGKDFGKLAWKDKPLIPLSQYCGIDCDISLRGMIYMEPKLIKLGFYNLFRNLLMMASRVLGESEYRGMLCNKSYLEDLMAVYEGKKADSMKKLRNNPAVLKFEERFRKHYRSSLIKSVQLEIEQLEKEDADNSRKIANRQAKIKKYLEGQFTKKEEEKMEGLNFGSPKQLQNFLFTAKYGLKLKPFKLTESGQPSTDEESLQHLMDGGKDKSGFMKALLEHRGIEYLDSHYISGTYRLLDRINRVHTKFNIHGTVTGRLSSNDPNLQNIPRDTTASDIKRMFIAPPGYVLLEVDYSQAELRVVAELAKDKRMLKFFREGYNIHVATACQINNAMHRYDEIKAIIKKGDSMDGEELKKPENKDILFWLKQKKRAKTLNFAILYGQTEKKLSIELDCSEKEAKQFIKQWFKAYPQVAQWIEDMKKFVRKHKYVVSIFGRKRRLYDIDSPKFFMQLEAERQAVNTPIQGAASDFALFSTVIIREKVLAGELPIDMQQSVTVHDSIQFHIRPADIHWVVPIIKEICNNPQTMKYFGFELKDVQMKVSPEVGASWGELTEYDPKMDYRTLLKQAA
jgi:DNA polymerase I-like protein with 3'-5' exonuclease and polymerase domains